jgi:hypothetical protein
VEIRVRHYLRVAGRCRPAAILLPGHLTFDRGQWVGVEPGQDQPRPQRGGLPCPAVDALGLVEAGVASRAFSSCQAKWNEA